MTRVTEAHVEARRDDILNAALDLFGQQGVEDTTMAEIAAAAGLSAGAIYRYFPGKEELFEACYERAQDEARRIVSGARSESGGPLQRLEAAGKAVLRDGPDRLCADGPLMLECGLRAARSEGSWSRTFRREAERTFDALVETVEAAQQAGQVDPGLDPPTVATLLYAAVPGYRMAQLAVSNAATADSMIELVCELLGRTGDGG